MDTPHPRKPEDFETRAPQGACPGLHAPPPASGVPRPGATPQEDCPGIDALHWGEAAPADEDALFALMEAFYTEERVEFRPEGARAALRALLREPRAGRVFLLRDPCAPAAPPAGYVVMAFWHSLEFGGRVALLDEFYLAPAARGRGRAPRALAMLRDWARAQGATAIRLEVNHHNARALRLYLRAGFQDDRRDVLTLRLQRENHE